MVARRAGKKLKAKVRGFRSDPNNFRRQRLSLWVRILACGPSRRVWKSPDDTLDAAILSLRVRRDLYAGAFGQFIRLYNGSK